MTTMNARIIGRGKYQMNKIKYPVFLSGVHLMQCLVVALLIISCLVLYGIIFSDHSIFRYREQCRQVEELDAKIEKLREENHRSFRRIQGFKKDLQAQERLVREQLGWTRENELMFEFPVPRKDRQ